MSIETNSFIENWLNLKEGEYLDVDFGEKIPSFDEILNSMPVTDAVFHKQTLFLSVDLKSFPARSLFSTESPNLLFVLHCVKDDYRKKAKERFCRNIRKSCKGLEVFVYFFHSYNEKDISIIAESLQNGTIELSLEGFIESRNSENLIIEGTVFTDNFK